MTKQTFLGTFRTALTAVSCATALTFTATANAETVRLANGDWAPYMAENLKEAGVISDIVKKAYAKTGHNVEYTFLPWKRGFEMAKNAELDGSIVWSKTAEREADFLYSEPVVDLQTVFFITNSSNFNWNTVDDLKGKKIGGVIGYSYGLEDAEKAGTVNINRIASPENNYKKLTNNRLDAVAEDRDAGMEIVHTLGIKDQVKIHPKPVKSRSYHLIISKKAANAQAKIDAFNQGLSELKSSGDYQTMLDASSRGEYKQ